MADIRDRHVVYHRGVLRLLRIAAIVPVLLLGGCVAAAAAGGGIAYSVEDSRRSDDPWAHTPSSGAAAPLRLEATKGGKLREGDRDAVLERIAGVFSRWRRDPDHVDEPDPAHSVYAVDMHFTLDARQVALWQRDDYERHDATCHVYFFRERSGTHVRVILEYAVSAGLQPETLRDVTREDDVTAFYGSLKDAISRELLSAGYAME